MTSNAIDSARPARIPQRLPISIQICVALVLPLTLWFWLCKDRPSQLGFYSDDWMILLHPFTGSATAFWDIMSVVATRPASAPYIWIAQVLVDWSPARAQVLNSAMLALTSFAVGCLTSRLATISGFSRQGALAGSSFAATAFICFPSNIGTFCWSVGVVAVVPATPLFCFGMVLLLSSSKQAMQRTCGLILLTISHLSYEAFYFQEVTIIAAAFVLGKTEVDVKPLKLSLTVVTINLACVVFNRLLPGGIHKAFNSEWLSIFVRGYGNIEYTFIHSVREHGTWVFRSLIGTVVFGSLCLGSLAAISRMLLFAIVLCCGVAAAGILYAFAGYGLAFEGPMARVAIVIAVYFSIAIGVLFAATWDAMRQHRSLSFISLIATLGLLLSFAVVSTYRLAEWSDAWSVETARLSRIPDNFQFRENDTRVFLAVEENVAGFVAPATAPWEIVGAVAWSVYNRSRAHDRRMMINIWEEHPTAFRWFATPARWFNRWDGKRFEQGPCGTDAAAYASKGSELWIWHTSQAELQEVMSPWNWGCD